MQEVAGLTIVEDGAEDLVVAGGDGQRVGVDGGEHVAGVRTTSGRVIEAKAVVLTTGTFLRGVVHLGLDNYPAGRHKRDRFVCTTLSIRLTPSLNAPHAVVVTLLCPQR